MRIFIAVSLPVLVKKILREAQGTDDAIRWQSSYNFHITLQFLGELSMEKINVLAETLGDVNQHVFSLALCGGGTFSAKGTTQVIWVGVKPVEPVLKLHKIIQDKCHQIGLETPGGQQPYVPHITLGRVTHRFEQKDIKKMLNKPMEHKHEFLVDRFAVYKSERISTGAHHTIIQEYPLVF